MVLVPCHSPLVYPEEVFLRRRVTRHCLSNRYTLQIEIAATPTKQTVGTRANRYNLAITQPSVGDVSRRAGESGAAIFVSCAEPTWPEVPLKGAAEHLVREFPSRAELRVFPASGSARLPRRRGRAGG